MQKIDFYRAAKRHFADAELLQNQGRQPNAGQLFGFSVECGIKALLVWQGYPTNADGNLAVQKKSRMGSRNFSYVPKLSRVYCDLFRDGRMERFAERIRRLVRELEQSEQPDIVLIDSRAGLHDLAAVSIVGLATLAYLFATDTASTWQAYRLLFSHWQAHPVVLRNIRERLHMVEARFPEARQVEQKERFLEHAYTLFSETIYETVKPNENSADADSSLDVFNFDLGDPAAPHYPLLIKWSQRFQEFHPSLLSSGILTEADIAASFGDFLVKTRQLIDGE